MKLTFKDIEERGLLLYKYIRGSQAYGTNTPESDRDEGGIFIAPQEWIDGLGFDYSDEISDEKHDSSVKYRKILFYMFFEVHRTC